jgi:hypothetical protein
MRGGKKIKLQKADRKTTRRINVPRDLLEAYEPAGEIKHTESTPGENKTTENQFYAPYKTRDVFESTV